MSRIKVAFWNLQNLFDTTASEIASDLEFTPKQGWTPEVLERKLDNLAAVINLMHGGQGPDLLGICEIENASVARRLIERLSRRDLKLTHIESPDIRGIDTSLIFSDTVFELVGQPVGHLVHLRFPTRDIFEVPLRVRETGAELLVLANHWPSRMLGQYESEPYRISVAEHCGRLVDRALKLTREEFLALPNRSASLQQVNARWNRNVLVMGDFNDEPFNRSVLDYLLASRDRDHVEVEILAARGRKLPAPKDYLAQWAFVLNCMWPLLGRPGVGTFHFSSAVNPMMVLDQFCVSRGLLLGTSRLRADLDSVRIFTPGLMTTRGGNPREFDRETKAGFSDHFPIEMELETV
jgi:hypothetical protein